MLESLIKPAQINGSAVSRETAIVRLPLHRIVDNPYQPRDSSDDPKDRILKQQTVGPQAMQ